LARRLAGERRLRAVMPADVRAVQCTLFEKKLDKNWLVTLHQDLSIPVAERIENDRCTGWSQKEGVLFVQPPSPALEELVIVRVHLDDCDERNGALRVVPGSHRLGRLSPAQASQVREVRGECLVPVAAGGAMLMRPVAARLFQGVHRLAAASSSLRVRSAYTARRAELAASLKA